MFEVLIASVPDRENLVAEIWYNDLMIAEVNQESERVEIEFYMREQIAFDFDTLFEALKIAKEKLEKL